MVIDSMRVDVAVSGMLEFLVELSAIQFFCLSAGEVSGQGDLGPKSQLVWTETHHIFHQSIILCILATLRPPGHDSQAPRLPRIKRVRWMILERVRLAVLTTYL